MADPFSFYVRPVQKSDEKEFIALTVRTNQISAEKFGQNRSGVLSKERFEVLLDQMQAGRYMVLVAVSSTDSVSQSSGASLHYVEHSMQEKDDAKNLKLPSILGFSTLIPHDLDLPAMDRTADISIGSDHNKNVGAAMEKAVMEVLLTESIKASKHAGYPYINFLWSFAYSDDDAETVQKYETATKNGFEIVGRFTGVVDAANGEKYDKLFAQKTVQ